MDELDIHPGGEIRRQLPCKGHPREKRRGGERGACESGIVHLVPRRAHELQLVDTGFFDRPVAHELELKSQCADIPQRQGIPQCALIGIKEPEGQRGRKLV